ncbi:MAG: GNAT family acetyltransferase [Pseudomonadota bacterium]
MDIRPIEDGDIESVVALWESCDLLRPWNDPHADIARAHTAPQSEIFVLADEDGTIVASAMAGDDGHRGWPYYVAVSPDRRGEGLGKAIMDHAENWLKAQGASKVNLMIRSGNPVQAFYEAAGYEVEDRVVMAKWLTEPPARDKPAELDVTITYLEMLEQPARGPARPPRLTEKIALMRAERPTVGFYRYLYNAVGEPWLWYERNQLSDEALTAIIQDEQVEVCVLYYAGTPAGYAELDFRQKGEIELAYFGLIPDYIGLGLGSYLLDWAIDTAWSRNPRRLWVNTCTLDHPAALPVYQKAGFMPCDQETIRIKDPRLG